MRWSLALIVLLNTTAACSAVQSVYVQPGYDIHQPSVIKRIAVVGWAPAAQPGLDAVLSHVTADLIKLRKNYLVHTVGIVKQSWAETCDKLEGVLAVRTLRLLPQEGNVTLALTAELYDCRDGAMVWRAAGERRGKSADADLASLTDVYRRELGAAAETYAAPAFALVQQLIESLPDPILNDDDVLEKIEIGAAAAPRLAQRH